MMSALGVVGAPQKARHQSPFPFHTYMGTDTYVPVTEVQDYPAVALSRSAKGNLTLASWNKHAKQGISIPANIHVKPAHPIESGKYLHYLLLQDVSWGGYTGYGYIKLAKLPTGLVGITSTINPIKSNAVEGWIAGDGTTKDFPLSIAFNSTGGVPVKLVLYYEVLDTDKLTQNDQGGKPFTVTVP
jgi:hypothetical protein